MIKDRLQLHHSDDFSSDFQSDQSLTAPPFSTADSLPEVFFAPNEATSQAINNAGTTTTSSGGSTGSSVVFNAASSTGLIINLSFDSSVTTSPLAATIEAAAETAAQFFEQTFSSPITINIDVGWGEVGGQTLATGALGESITNVTSYNYTQLRNGLINTANASGDASQLSAASTLPSTNPTNSNTFTIADAEAKTLGLSLGSSPPTVDGYVGFSSSSSLWSFSPTLTPTGTEYYFIGVAEHEISEVMGRFSDIGTGAYSLMDLFRYSSSGVRDLTANTRHSTSSPYFSIDNGTTNLSNWNNYASRGDLGDWSLTGTANTPNDAFNYAATPGVITPVSNTDITLMNVLGYDLACFAPGTRIVTPDGETPVEMLSSGDLVMTADGRALPIRWIGRSTVSTRFADPLRVLPIRIMAGALGENLPVRDLLLSPDHALFLDGVLLQAGALVNGSSIVREHNMPEQLTYFHIELDEHSLILAENTPAETFIDNVDRMSFDNWQEHQTLYPAGKGIVEMPYPRAKAHRQIPQAIRQLLTERAAIVLGQRQAQEAAA